jgi:hypothetical protein
MSLVYVKTNYHKDNIYRFSSYNIILYDPLNPL